MSHWRPGVVARTLLVAKIAVLSFASARKVAVPLGLYLGLSTGVAAVVMLVGAWSQRLVTMVERVTLADMWVLGPVLRMVVVI